MRSPTLRHVVHLRLTLGEHDPAVWREVVVDREATLAELHQLVVAVLGGPRCDRHVFTAGTADPSRVPPSRRWGNRWTMIDFRDPTVIDDRTARIGVTLERNGGLLLRHTCAQGWTVAITPGIDDIEPMTEPPFRVIAGAGRAPLPCSKGGYEHSVIVAALGDPAHPDHEAFRDHDAWLRGPWAEVAADGPDGADGESGPWAVDIDDIATSGLSEPTLPFVTRLPPAAQPGARKHVALAGLGLPSVVTSAETEDFVRVFRWFLLKAGADGIPVQAGAIEPSFLTDAAAVLDVDDTRLHKVFVAAKRLQLVYSRQGRLRAKKQLLVSAATAPALWSSLAKALRDERTTSGAARDLLLLSIADASFGTDTGMREIAHAYALISAVHAATRPQYWHEDRYSDCASQCECATSAHGSWHDLVTESVRRASDAARADGAEPVLSSFDHYEREIPPDWLDGYDARWGLRDADPVTTDPADRRDADLARLLRDVSPMIEVLAAFGLTLQSDGSWIIPPALREFARAALAPSLGDPKADDASMYDYVQSDAW